MIQPGDVPAQATPVDITRIVAEVREEIQQRIPPGERAQPLGGSAGDADKALLALAVQRHLENQEVLGRSQIASPAAAPSSASPDQDALPPRHEQGEDFEHNREQLYHPPVQTISGRLKSLATVLTIALLLMVLYTGYVNGLFNSVLPETLQHHASGLQRVAP